MAVRHCHTARFAGLCLWSALAAPPLRHALEAGMVTHMGLQLPLLALVGGLLAIGLHRRSGIERRLAEYGPALLLLAILGASVWMLPRALDAALASRAVEIAKFLGLPLAVGLPIGLSWPHLSTLGKGFALANTISMLATVGWLYQASPVRICAWYRIDQQQLAGTAMVTVAVGLALVLAILALRGKPSGDAS